MKKWRIIKGKRVLIEDNRISTKDLPTSPDKTPKLKPDAIPIRKFRKQIRIGGYIGLENGLPKAGLYGETTFTK